MRRRLVSATSLRSVSLVWWSDATAHFRVKTILTTPREVSEFIRMRLGYTNEADARAQVARLNAELDAPAPIGQAIEAGDHVVRMRTDGDDDDEEQSA
jgi:hypothetical protein